MYEQEDTRPSLKIIIPKRRKTSHEGSVSRSSTCVAITSETGRSIVNPEAHWKPRACPQSYGKGQEPFGPPKARVGASSRMVTGMFDERLNLRHVLMNSKALGKSKSTTETRQPSASEHAPSDDEPPSPSERSPSVSVKTEEKIVRLTIREGREKIKSKWNTVGWTSTQIASDIEELTAPVPEKKEKKKSIVSWGRSFVVSTRWRRVLSDTDDNRSAHLVVCARCPPFVVDRPLPTQQPPVETLSHSMWRCKMKPRNLRPRATAPASLARMRVCPMKMATTVSMRRFRLAMR